jgi:hypothetical protein
VTVDSELLAAHEREKIEIREEMESKFKKEIELAQNLV